MLGTGRQGCTAWAEVKVARELRGEECEECEELVGGMAAILVGLNDV